MKTKKMIKTLFAGLLCGLLLLALTACGSSTPVIGISQYGEHASLDNCRIGFLQGLAEAGLTGRRGTLLVNSDNATNAAAAEAIAASLRESGLEIEVLTAAGSNYDSLVELGGYDLLYCEVRLTADFDLSTFFGGALSDYAIQHNDAPALCAAAMENSGNFYDLHRLIMDEGLLCPILFKTRAVMTDRGSVSGLTPAPVNVFYQLDRLSILTGGAKEESQ